MVTADPKWSWWSLGFGRTEVFGAFHQIPLFDQMVVQRFSVVFNQSFMGWRMLYDGFQ